jgi:hypothetical protein
LVGSPQRELLALFGSTAVLLGLIKLRPPQFDRETLARWLEFRDGRSALMNGLELGSGVLTRLGYWLWYLIPLGCIATSNWAVGAMIWATYSLIRLITSAGLAIASSPGIYWSNVRTSGAARWIVDVLTGASLGMFIVRLAATLVSFG